jgi:hypothetical protein
MVVAMTRLAVRMVPGGGVANSLWNFVPAVSLLVMTVFLPSMIKRLLGQGNTGTGLITTAAYALAGLKGLSLAAGGQGASGAAAVAPPASGAMPKAPSGPSSYPVAPLSSSHVSSGSTARHGAPPIEEVWVTTPSQLQAGAASPAAGIEAPYVPKPGDEYVIDLGQSEPGSDKWDMVLAVEAFDKGRRAAAKPINPE